MCILEGDELPLRYVRKRGGRDATTRDVFGRSVIGIFHIPATGSSSKSYVFFGRVASRRIKRLGTNSKQEGGAESVKAKESWSPAAALAVTVVSWR